ncbi:MAG: hypothetical protein ACREA2_19405 [Blastocatellia bacterium]
MTLNQAKFAQVVAAAKAKAANSPAWLKAIDRAAAAILSGDMCVSLFADGTALVTTPNNSYVVNGHCACRAAQHGHKECYHRAGKRLAELYDEAPESTPAPEAAPAPKAPTITRSIERDPRNGVKVVAVRCNGWLI